MVLHRCAISAIRRTGAMISYFICKVKGGKNKVRVTNATDTGYMRVSRRKDSIYPIKQLDCEVTRPN
jgi:hypothetical protein